MKYIHILLIVSIITGIGSGAVKSAVPKAEQIQEEIEIMEGILNTLFSKAVQNDVFSTGGADGYYLEDYGVLFKVPYDRHEIRIGSWISGNEEENVIIMSKEMHRGKKQVEIKQIGQPATNDSLLLADIEQSKATITRFLGDYASAMHGLGDDNWLMVVIDFNSKHNWVGTLNNDNDVRKLTAKVKMEDVSAYRMGKLKRAQLRNKISFETQKGGMAVDDDIAVFADIIWSKLEKKHRCDIHIFDPINGCYLDGYGAVFMLNTQMMPRNLHIFTNKNLKNGNEHSYTFESFVGNDDEPVDFDDNINALQNEIIDVMSRFGHTIRKVHHNEIIEIAISVDSHGFDQDVSRIIMKLNKADIDRNQKKKNLENLQKKIRVIKY